MDLKKLEMFRAVANRGSLRIAATEMGLTLAAVSIQIKKLEKELGIELFHHLPNRLVLTDRGQAFLRETNRVFEALDRATSVASGTTSTYASSVSIALSSDVLKFIAPRISGFMQRYPSIDLSIISRSSFSSLSMVMDNEADMCIGFYREVPRGLHKINILKTGIALVHAPGKSPAKRKKMSLQDIAGSKLITLRRASATRRMIDTVLAGHGFIPGNVTEVSNCQAVLEMVEIGLGVGLIHGICAKADHHDKVEITDVAHCFDTFDLALVVRSDTLLGGIHEALIAELTQQAKR
jgi:LysR family hydrogen peroxide-inducible transcriptional activator